MLIFCTYLLILGESAACSCRRAGDSNRWRCHPSLQAAPSRCSRAPRDRSAWRFSALHSQRHNKCGTATVGRDLPTAHCRSCRAPVAEAGAHERRLWSEQSTGFDRRLWRSPRHWSMLAPRQASADASMGNLMSRGKFNRIRRKTKKFK